MIKNVKLTPYIARFTLAYTVALVVVAVIMEILDIDSGTGGSIGSLMVAVMYSVSIFVKEQKRVPSRNERKWLTWYSLIASIFVSLILVIGFLIMVNQFSLLASLPDLVSEVGVGIISGITIFVLGLYSLAIWFTYGWFAKMQYKEMEKKGEI